MQITENSQKKEKAKKRREKPIKKDLWKTEKTEKEAEKSPKINNEIDQKHAATKSTDERISKDMNEEEERPRSTSSSSSSSLVSSTSSIRYETFLDLC